MRKTDTIFRLFIAFAVVFLFNFCSKSDDNINTGDPSNLNVEVLSVDNETGAVTLQATAENVVQFQLFIEASAIPAATNETGYFEYTFDQPGDFTIEVRAYGTSGRYIKDIKTVTITSEGGSGEIPLGQGYFSPEEYDGYSRIWEDEFTGTSVNSSNWTFETGDGCPYNCGWGNNELEYYRAENAWVADDVLTIEARKENYSGRSYTSARMISKNKFSFQYGRVDIRAVLPKGQGIWPALWMLGNNISTVGWPACGETDIMEMVGGNGREKTVHGTCHWDVNGHAQYGLGYAKPSGTFADEYHVFSIIWDESKIEWFVNNIKYCELNITSADMSEFHQPNFFIMNVAVGGTWPGEPNSFTVFPQQMKVDYIRVFQKN